MRLLFFTLLLFLSLFSIQAQVVDIPDPNFLQALIRDGVDSNRDGMIQVSEAEALTEMDVFFRNIQDLTGIQSFINLKELNCGANELTSLDISSLTELEILEFRSNEITEIDLRPLQDLKEVDCISNKLSILNIADLDSLKILDCSANLLETLDLNGVSNLRELRVALNDLIELDVSSSPKLTQLICLGNELTELDVSQTILLEELDCSINSISTLKVENLTGLSDLECGSNNLQELDVTDLINLESFTCGNNQLTSLDVSDLARLRLLQCQRNLLDTLNLSGLSRLSSVICFDNELVDLTLTGASKLGSIDCGNNKLKQIDLSTLTKLVGISCTENLLKSIDISNSPLMENIDVTANDSLDVLYLKNGVQSFFGLHVEMDLCPNLRYICADNWYYQWFKDQVDNLNYNCVVNSYCSFTPGGQFYSINGTVRFDQNGDACDSLNQTIPYTYFNITNSMDSGQFITNDSGYYEIYVQEGTHTIKPILDNPDYFNITPDSAIIEFPSDTNLITQNFCLTPAGNFPDVGVTIIPLTAARPGFESSYKIIYFNSGTDTLSGDFTLSYEDDLMDFVSSSQTPSDDSPSLLTWTYNDLAPFERRNIEVTMLLNTPTDDPPLLGDDVLEFTSTINPIGGDANDQDNEFILNQTVVNSYDPNDKTCLQGDIIKPELIGEYVDYLIRFENTGTASAVNVVVKDVIDETRFDVSSLRIIDASHKVDTRISEGNTVEFIFENIELPFEDDSNDGYILFKIKTLSTLSIGDVLTNDAEIFFDFNPAIETNVATSEINIISAIEDEINEELKINLYPNPAKTEMNVTSESAINMIEIRNLLGQTLRSSFYTDPTKVTTLDVGGIERGSCFVVVYTVDGMHIEKVVLH